MDILITYSTVYGASAYYAGLLASELGTEAHDLDDAAVADADILVHFAGLYAGSINGLRKAVSRLPEDRVLILCTVGLADPGKESTAEEIRRIAGRVLKGRRCTIFSLRGDMDYSRLTPKHRAMMWALVRMLKARRERSEEDEALIATYGGKLDFKDPSAIIPVIEHIRSIAY